MLNVKHILWFFIFILILSIIIYLLNEFEVIHISNIFSIFSDGGQAGEIPPVQDHI